MGGCDTIVRLVAAIDVADKTRIQFARPMDCGNGNTCSNPSSCQYGYGILGVLYEVAWVFLCGYYRYNCSNGAVMGIPWSA